MGAPHFANEWKLVMTCMSSGYTESINRYEITTCLSSHFLHGFIEKTLHTGYIAHISFTILDK